jgi:hypothetical protein
LKQIEVEDIVSRVVSKEIESLMIMLPRMLKMQTGGMQVQSQNKGEGNSSQMEMGGQSKQQLTPIMR